MDTTQLAQLFAALVQNAQNNTDYMSPETVGAFANKATNYRSDLESDPALLLNKPTDWLNAAQTLANTEKTIQQFQNPDPLTDLLRTLNKNG